MKLKFKAQVKVWSWSSKLKFEVEVQLQTLTSNLNVELQLQTLTSTSASNFKCKLQLKISNWVNMCRVHKVLWSKSRFNFSSISYYLHKFLTKLNQNFNLFQILSKGFSLLQSGVFLVLLGCDNKKFHFWTFQTFHALKCCSKQTVWLMQSM